jgi:hypothetical protein
MRRLLLLTIGVLAPVAFPQAPTTLAALRNDSRPLLIFAPRPDDPQLLMQLRDLKDEQHGLSERHVVVLAAPYNNPSPTEHSLTSTDAEAARRRFKIAPGDFTVLLIGKDGGEKLRTHKPISFEILRRTIDAMPMRQQEMHEPTKNDRSPS